MVHVPHFEFETKYWEKGLGLIGVDEVGYGSLAGPIYIGAVCLPPSLSPDDRIMWKKLGIRDSKELSENKRQILAPTIRERSLVAITASSSVEAINQYGIVKAREAAIRQAIQLIIKQVAGRFRCVLLTDAFHLIGIESFGLVGQQNIIRGDQQSICIAASSVIAKVARDEHITSLGKKFPHYGWARNKGYATAEHIRAIKMHGVSPLHRNLYVRNFIEE